jgi:hypothetical protein
MSITYEEEDFRPIHSEAYAQKTVLSTLAGVGTGIGLGSCDKAAGV